jgi:multisubunit Na+/H+ antiporter MnhF subunit
VTAWSFGAAVLFVALAPCLVTAMRGRAPDRLVGLEALSIVASMLLVVLSRMLGQTFLLDLALALALLALGGGLVFARFLERWL